MNHGDYAMTWKICLKHLARLVAYAAITTTAMAHHAATNFDHNKQYIFHGTVRKFLWQNPHSWLYVAIEKADGKTEIWGFEGSGPNTLARSGWHATDLKEGENVTVYGNPENNGKHNAIMAKVILSNGRVLNPLPLPDAAQLPGDGKNPDSPPAGIGGRSVTPVEYK
jgi:hypothetical protein